MHADPVARLCLVHGQRGRIAHRATLEVIGKRQQRCEAGVDPVHDRTARAEIAPQAQRDQRHATDALLGCLQEQRDVGLAERIDGLHRVADAEERPAVTALPAGEQQRQQLLLRGRSVLVFVHQQVMDPVIEREREFRRRGIVAQRVSCSAGDCRVVEAAAFGE